MPRPGEHLLLSSETREVIGAAMEVHRRLGPGYLESVYESALAHELGLRGIQFVEQGRLEVRYKGMVVGDFKYDFLVEKSVIVELKAVRALSDADDAQLQNYLRGTGIQVGLLINFGAPSLEWRRRVWTKITRSESDQGESSKSA